MSIYIYNKGIVNINQENLDFDDIINDYYGRKKIANQIIEKAYFHMRSSKAKRLHDCWSHIKIARHKITRERKLIFANSCKVRLCPCCAWRRSRKYAIENKHMLYDINGKYIFLTVTVRNCKETELSATLDIILNAWKRFYQRKDIKKIMLGSVRNLEITYNSLAKTFHPHMHILIHTAPTYFGADYIKHDTWSAIWQDCARLDYIPIVDVRRVKPGSDNTFFEISKYVSKISDLLSLPESDLYKVVKVLDYALTSRRIIGYTGTFRKWRKEHKLQDDIKDAEIISEESEDWEIFCYEWIYGKNQYIRV